MSHLAHIASRYSRWSDHSAVGRPDGRGEWHPWCPRADPTRAETPPSEFRRFQTPSERTSPSVSIRQHPPTPFEIATSGLGNAYDSCRRLYRSFLLPTPRFTLSPDVRGGPCHSSPHPLIIWEFLLPPYPATNAFLGSPFLSLPTANVCI